MQAFKYSGVEDEFDKLNSKEAQQILGIQMTRVEFGESMGLKPDSKFVESMFNIMDKVMKAWPHRARRVDASRPHRVRDLLLHFVNSIVVTTPSASRPIHMRPSPVLGNAKQIANADAFLVWPGHNFTPELSRQKRVFGTSVPHCMPNF